MPLEAFLRLLLASQASSLLKSVLVVCPSVEGTSDLDLYFFSRPPPLHSFFPNSSANYCTQATFQLSTKGFLDWETASRQAEAG